MSDKIKMLIIGISGTPIFEVGERISSFHELDFITIEREPSGNETYFEDKIPTQYIDTGDFLTGSESQHKDRDPLSSWKEKELNDLEVPYLESKLLEEEIGLVFEEEEGVVVSEIPDKRLVEWATHVCVLNADTEIAIEWFSRRRKCYTCGAVFHLDDKMPMVNGICDRCGSDLGKLESDNPENVRELYAQWRKNFNRIKEACKDKANYLQVRVDVCKDFEDICVKVDRWLRKTSNLYEPVWQYEADRKHP